MNRTSWQILVGTSVLAAILGGTCIPSTQTPSSTLPVVFNSCAVLGPNCTVASGTQPASITAADFDRDGNVDLAVANFGDGTVTILRNIGLAMFTPFAVIPVGATPTGVVAADFNKDGIPDLAVASNVADVGPALTILLGLGTGTFQTPVIYRLVDLPAFITAANMNFDNLPDVVTANPATGSLSVLLNDGLGNLVGPFDYLIGGTPVWVVAADLINNGRTAVAVADQANNTIPVLRNTGVGTLFGQVNFAAGGTRPVSIAAADFFGHGITDLAVANKGAPDDLTGTVTLLANAGNATLAATVTLFVGPNPLSIVTGDWNHDGFPDLAVANFGDPTGQGASVSILLNLGRGVFGQALNYAAGAGCQAMAVGDFNRDGSLDLAVANFLSNDVSILLNDGTGAFTGL